MERSEVDGRREGGPEEDGCHKLEDTCTQKRRMEDGREGGQGPKRTVEPWSSSSSSNKTPLDEGSARRRDLYRCVPVAVIFNSDVVVGV